MATPYDTVHLDRVASTQDVARQAFASGGTVLVVADRQVGGRGRTGREWWEAPRAMYSSLAVEPAWPEERWGVLPLVAGLAVREALASRFGAEVGLKWPNDLVLDGRKAGGILVESSGGVVVVGCGVNLWWPEAPESAVGVVADDPGAAAGAQLAQRWADGFLARTANDVGSWGRDEYRAACLTIGTEVQWTVGGEVRSAMAVDVDEWGGLVVEGEEREVLTSGEVRQVRSATLPPDPVTGGDGE